MEQGLHKGHNLLYYECTEWKTPERTKCRDEKDSELLQALADSRNITKAADKLYITPVGPVQANPRHRTGAGG